MRNFYFNFIFVATISIMNMMEKPTSTITIAYKTCEEESIISLYVEGKTFFSENEIISPV